MRTAADRRAEAARAQQITEELVKNPPEIVIVKSLMTGKDVAIRAVDQGGPCDPSTERYWSM
jgi:hypothetical protein